MQRQTRDTKENSGSAPGKSIGRGFDDDLLLNSEYSNLFGSISEFMMGRFDIEDVKNDPAFSDMERDAKEMVSDYNKNIAHDKENEKFIRDVFAVETQDREIEDEIDQIKIEIGNSNINEISSEWVKEWHEKRQKPNGKDPKTEEIRDFITGSLESEKSEPEISLPVKRKRVLLRPHMVRFISLSAAAVITIFLVVSTLLPSSDPGKLYDTYYEPFNAVSLVTRGVATDEPDSYSAAVESYKLGDYQTAATGFSYVMLNDPSSVESRFYMGLTQIEMENFRQAVNLLNVVAEQPGEYRKDAEWYLGMAYLKTGEKEKARVCFDLLAQSPGFYRERAGKILRRLK